MAQTENFFKSFGQFTEQRQKKVKKTDFIKKVTFDLDAEHMAIIEARQKMAGVHQGLRGVIWEALELLADTYQLVK